jgi:hypothetical protein
MTKATQVLHNASQVVSTNDIRDIRPPVVIPRGWAWVGWTLLVLAVAVAAFFLWRWWKKRKAIQAIVPPVPPHVRAKQRLAAALALLGQPREFCFLVSDVLRLYLEERFNFRAPERTTEEFLLDLKKTDLLTRDQKESLEDFLTRCDLVKFAKYEPREPELHELHAAALRLVEETEPLPEPGVASVSAPGADGVRSAGHDAANRQSPIANSQAQMEATPSRGTDRQPELVNRKS